MRGSITALVLALAAVQAAVAAEPVTKTEARKMRPDVLRHRVLEQLGDILIEDPRPQQGRPPVTPLDYLGYTTRPRPTPTPGLCVVDTVSVSFEPAGLGDLNAETPMRATGVTAGHGYYALWPAPPVDPTEAERRRWRNEGGRCAGVDFWKEQFTSADSVEMVAEGLSLYSAFRRMHKPPLKLPDGGCGKADLDCSAAFAVLDPLGPKAVDSVAFCDDGMDGQCWKLEVGGHIELRLHVVRNYGIVRAELHEYVIIADAKRD